MKKVRTPQRLVAVTKYLTKVMQDDKAPERLRMQAAERICDLYLESERNKTARVIAIARAESRAQQAAEEKTAQSIPEPVEQPPSAVSDVSQEVKAYLAQFTKTA